MAYKHLSKDDRAEIAEQQVKQLEAERFGHELNIVRLDGIPKTRRDETWETNHKSAEDAIQVIDDAIKATEAEAKSLRG